MTKILWVHPNQGLDNELIEDFLLMTINYNESVNVWYIRPNLYELFDQLIFDQSNIESKAHTYRSCRVWEYF